MSRVTEGSGVGVSTEPPVSPRHAATAAGPVVATQVVFEISLTEVVRVRWDTVLAGDRLFVEVPAGVLPAGSRESFVALLEYAEEQLRLKHVIVSFRAARSDRACLVRTFMFLGFSPVAPGACGLPIAPDLVFMAYTIEPGDSSDEDDTTAG